MVTAAAQDQWRLLDVQEHDTRLAQIAHRRRTLPELATITELQARLAQLDAALVAARTTAGDIARELAKAEADVELVRSRAARDRSRLDAGQGTPKDLQALQRELERLASRQEVLEEAELEVMERQEAAEAAVAAADAERATVAGDLIAAERARDDRFAALDAEAEQERAARAGAAAGLPAALLALYERVREQSGGVGAARLQQRRCEGCRLELNAGDLARIRAAGADDVVRCEECGRILVRTAESGL